MIKVIFGILIPFLGTSLGSAMVFFMSNKLNSKLEKFFLGLAGGVMMSASIWSLILPAIEQTQELNLPIWLPATLGLIIGFIVLFLIEAITQKMHNNKKFISTTREKSMMILAVTLHNIPEGLAVGVALAGAYIGSSSLSLTSALVLSIGIAIQNFPEGAIVSMPLKSGGMSKGKSFFFGVLSGIVEPISAIIAFLITEFIVVILPFILAFAGGTMIYVVVKELIPESQESGYEFVGTLGFATGFIIMMLLDVILG